MKRRKVSQPISTDWTRKRDSKKKHIRQLENISDGEDSDRHEQAQALVIHNPTLKSVQLERHLKPRQMMKDRYIDSKDWGLDKKMGLIQQTVVRYDALFSPSKLVNNQP